MLTFVTAYYNIYPDSPPFDRSNEWRLNHFRTLAETGIPICLYVSDDYTDVLQTFVQDFPNVKLMPSIPFDEMWVVKKCTAIGEYTLPEKRHPTKDTVAYLQLKIAKLYLSKTQ